MDVSKLIRGGAALAITILPFAAGTAQAENPPPVAGCGNGLTLVFNPATEAFIAASTQGNVNGDGWICRNNDGLIHSNGHFNFVVVIDNNVPLSAAG